MYLLANAVAKFDNLQFLSDTVPRTVTYKQVKEKKVAATTAAHSHRTTDTVVADGSGEESKQKSIASMMQPTVNGVHRAATPPAIRDHSMANSPIIDRTMIQANGTALSTSQDDDTDMQD